MVTRRVNAQYNATFYGHLWVTCRLIDEFNKWCFTLYRTAVVESSPCMREIGVRSPVETDPSRLNRLWQINCQSVSRFFVDDHYKGLPHVIVGVANKLHCSIATSAGYSSNFAAFHRRNEWKILERDKNKTKQTKKKTHTNVWAVFPQPLID